MKKLLIILFLLWSIPLWATIRYVDTLPAESGSGWNGSNGGAYTGTPGAGTGYTTIQAAVTAMAGGDDIYIRGGTYNENVSIPYNGTKDGTSGNWSSIQSYPGEWAIINGGNNAAYTLGYADTGSLGSHDLHYWQFERLEITGGTDGVEWGFGIGCNGGPFIVRYCYIHDNYAASGGENPGGVGGYCWRDSTIEYNCFYNNGSSGGDNGGDINIYADYRAAVEPTTYFNTGNYSGYYYARNIIRYNYFRGGDGSNGGNNGLRQKSSMNMVGNDTTRDFSLPYTYDDWGDNIHHNIFENYTEAGVQVWQDFAQVYNNIFYGSTESNESKGGLNIGSYSSDSYQKRAHPTLYNNTILNGGRICRYGGNDSSMIFYDHIMNNIVDYADDISLLFAYPGPAESSINMTGCTTNHNYVYRPRDSHTKVGSSTARTVSSFDTYHSTSNYYKASSEGSDNLMTGVSGADKYKTRGSHIITGSTTIANGGGGNHPYQAGVTIPSYVGAVNPSDSDWVAGVLAINVSYMTTATNGSTPTWIEGGSGTPTAPTSVNVTISNVTKVTH